MTSPTLSLDYDGSNLIFIVGCPRSGTTWVQRLLASHPCVKTGQESDVFDLYVGPQLRTWTRELDVLSSGRGGVGLGCYFREPDFMRILKDYTLRLLSPMVGSLRPGEIFVEKTPSHALYIPEILKLLPGARFVHVLRDARDTVASLVGASRSWGRAWAPGNASHATAMWIEHVQAARTAASSLGPTHFYEVRYEQLHAHTHATLRDLVTWIGLQWADAELDGAIMHNQANNARAGAGTDIPVGGVIGDISGPVVKEPAGFIRKADVGTWREDLSLGDRLRVWKLAHSVMREAGYTWRFPW